MTPTLYFHGDDVKPSGQQDALFHVIPAPYEKTVSYKSGTALGPQAILEASCQLELFDGKNIPADQGIYTSPFIDCTGDAEDVLPRIRKEVANCLSVNKIPVILGGEHTVTGAAVEALQECHNSFGVIQFDAHADLRDTYQGTPYSHACVMKRIHDRNIPIFQIGTRSYSYEEHLFRKKNSIPYLDAEDIFKSGVEGFCLPVDFPDKVFITFDIDGLDPALMPATGTPVPGGLTWYQTQWLIEKIMNSRICVGFDVVEFAPLNTLHSASFTAAQLTYNMMGYLTRSAVNRKYWSIGTV
ncbi:MAG: agmatinase [Desulfobulbaceae bacterium]|uniref:Agmatinase n=1 Tax=Candidatus Desulfobia pelagia TaxID=2841692 RepID=A0A8J6N902_9BACT|nr:agmatinase [Candidatus Desulfobia pelagia]